jgi:hypothetical protein
MLQAGRFRGSRPDEVDFFSNLPNLSGPTVALASTQPLTEISTRNLKKKQKKTGSKGRAIAQAVSRWLPTAAARVQNRVWSCGICGEQSGAGAGFLRVLRFPLPIFIPPVSPQSPSPIIRGWYKRPVVAAVSKVPPHKFKEKKTWE